MNFRLFLLLPVAMSLIATPPSKETAAKEELEQDMKAIQGTWMVVGRETRGKATPKKFVKKYLCDEIRFEKDKVFMNAEPETFKLDPTKSPKQIDVDNGAQQTLGIYKFEKGQLVICWNGPGQKERPARFQTVMEGPRTTLLYLERVKDADLDKREAQPRPRPTDAKQKAAVEGETKALQGVWKAVEWEAGGLSLPTNEPFFEFTKECTYRIRGEEKSGRYDAYSIDPTKSPKQIDFRIGRRWRPAIYKFDGQYLFIVMGGLCDKKRPMAFKTDSKDAFTLYKLERHKR